MHYNEIIREFSLTNGVAAYHLDVLEREGFLRSIRDGTLRRFYSTTSKVPQDHRLTPDQVRERILLLVSDSPGISQKAIVDELGIGRTLVGYHLKTLIDDGYLKASRQGRFTVYRRTNKRWFQAT
ncbi:MAG: winged helix-turn-helix transcriptional regulator, partial [Thermoplasmata archaeon]|nr:winged helix-turn-helix transcriptional regulator [Thermoplasmata archaeon]